MPKPVTKPVLRVAAIALLMLVALPLAFSAQIVLPAYRMPKPPTIDGVINPADWASAPSIDHLVDFRTGEPAPDAARFWIAYDDHYVYVAAQLADSRPTLIRANQYQTNVALTGDDSIDVNIDLSGSGRDFNTFSVNPKGATTTYLAGGRALKREWAGEFQAAARITASGWEMELRIPWHSMKLPPPGARDARVNFLRNVARTGRSFSAVFRLAGSTANLPIWSQVAIPKSVVDRDILLLPYGYVGYDPNIGAVLNSGLDVKTSLNDKVQFVGSLNPDFRNIENQILNLDFSHFAREANESRPFFLEGSGYEGTSIFDSQLIPRFDAGVNAYGKLNDKTSFGVLNTEQYGLGDDTVADVGYTPDASTSVRLATTDYNQQGVHNEAYAASIRKGWGPWALAANDAQSYDNYGGNGDSESLRLFYRQNGISSTTTVSRVTPNYLPRLALIPEVDYEGVTSFISYDRPWNRGPWSEAGVGGAYTVYDHVNGSDYRRSGNFSVAGTLRNGLSMSGDLNEDQFEGISEHQDSVALGYPANNPYDQINANYAWGSEEGNDYETLTLAGTRRLYGRLQLTGSYQIVNYLGINDQLILDANYDMKHDQAVYGRLTEQSGQVGGYLAYRRSGNLGAEYYVILGDPNAATFRPALIVKVVVPLRLRV